MSHPLAMVHSTRKDTKSEWFLHNGKSLQNTPEGVSPSDENDPHVLPRDHTAKKLQAIYSNGDGCAMYTDI